MKLLYFSVCLLTHFICNCCIVIDVYILMQLGLCSSTCSEVFAQRKTLWLYIFITCEFDDDF